MEFFFATIHELWASLHSGSWSELGPWSYILLVFLVATEGPMSTLLGAAAAATGILNLRYVFIGAFVGNVLGDCLWYTVGSVSTLDRIHRYGRWLGIREHHLEKLERGMHAHATKLIAVSKLAIGLIIPTLVAAGLARVPWRRWFPLVLVVETVWTIIVVNLGFHGAGMISKMEQSIHIVGAVVLFLLLLGVVKFVHHRSKEKKLEQDVAATTMCAPIVAVNNVHIHAVKGLTESTARHVTAAKTLYSALNENRSMVANSQGMNSSASSVVRPANPLPAHFAGD